MKHYTVEFFVTDHKSESEHSIHEFSDLEEARAYYNDMLPLLKQDYETEKRTRGAALPRGYAQCQELTEWDDESAYTLESDRYDGTEEGESL